MKKIFGLFISLSLFLAFSAVAGAVYFSDVDENTDYNKAITWMANNGIINGYPDGSFVPEDCVNRAEMLKLLFISSGAEILNEGELSYTDVNEEAWFFPYVLTATENGVVNGYDDGSFRPSYCVNRAEALKMGLNQFGIEVDSAEVMWAWEDISVDSWHYPFEYTAFGMNLVGMEHTTQGNGANGRFYPGESMTRKEASEFLYRLKTLVDNDLLEYSDDFEPNVLNTDFKYSDVLDIYYGSLSVSGYPVINEITDPFCELEGEENCEVYDYVEFVILDSDNDLIYNFIDSNFVGLDENEGEFSKIGLGCLRDGLLNYAHLSDMYGFMDGTLAVEDSDSLFAADFLNPIDLKLVKEISTMGTGAPVCYSPVNNIIVLD